MATEVESGIGVGSASVDLRNLKRRSVPVTVQERKSVEKKFKKDEKIRAEIDAKKVQEKQELNVLEQLGIELNESNQRHASKLVKSCQGIDFIIQLALLFIQEHATQYFTQPKDILQSFLDDFNLILLIDSPLKAILTRDFLSKSVPSVDEFTTEIEILQYMVHLHVKEKRIPTEFFYTLFPSTKAEAVSKLLSFFSEYHFITQMKDSKDSDGNGFISIDPKLVEMAKQDYPLSVQTRKALFRKALTFFSEPESGTEDDEFILEYQKHLVTVLAEDKSYFEILNRNNCPFEFSVSLGEEERFSQACHFLGEEGNLFHDEDAYKGSIELRFSVLELLMRTSANIDIVVLSIIRSISVALDTVGSVETRRLSRSMGIIGNYVAVGIIPEFFQNPAQVRNKTLLQCQGILLQYKNLIKEAKERFEDALKIEKSMGYIDNLHTYSCEKLLSHCPA